MSTRHNIPIVPDQQDDGDPGDESGDINAPIGSKATGYAGPDEGPFSCSNCVHFDGNSSCDNPKVIADPEVQGSVDPNGCCNYFRDYDDKEAQPEEGQPDQLKASLAATKPFGANAGVSNS